MTDHTAAINSIRAGITRLAASCDGASSEDGHGFNKFDATPGHDFARRIADGYEFSPKQLAYMGKLCNKYRGQLGEVLDVDAVKAFVTAVADDTYVAPPKAEREPEAAFFLTTGVHKRDAASGKAALVAFAGIGELWVPVSQLAPGTRLPTGKPADFAVATWYAKKNRLPASKAVAAFETPAPVEPVRTASPAKAPAPVKRAAPAPVAAPVAPPLPPRRPRAPVHIVD